MNRSKSTGYSLPRSRIVVVVLAVFSFTPLSRPSVATDLTDVTTYGPLVIIGGNENVHGRILHEFVHMSGGTSARIVVIPVATEYFPEAGAKYVKAFLGMGAKAVDVFHIASRDDANDQRLIETIEQATGVFFTGGDQARITDRLRNSAMQNMIQQRHSAGMVLAGTSAGAAMMSREMIRSGQSNATPAEEVVQIADGMSFVRGVIIDMHFSKRGRLGRLLAALAQNQNELGIGIDEDTALVVQNKHCRVIGKGCVTIVDASNARIKELQYDNDNPIALYGTRLSVIPAGFSFSFKDGSPIPDEPM